MWQVGRGTAGRNAFHAELGKAYLDHGALLRPKNSRRPRHGIIWGWIKGLAPRAGKARRDGTDDVASRAALHRK